MNNNSKEYPGRPHKLHLAIFLDYGGIESQIHAMANEYARRGMNKEVEFWCIGHGGFVANEIAKLGFNTKVLNQSVKIPNLNLIKDLAREIRKAKFDIVYTHGGEANFHGVISARIAGVPKVFPEEIGISNHTKFARFVFKYIFKFSTHIIAGSEVMKKSIMNLKEANSDKISVLYVPLEGRNSIIPAKKRAIGETRFVVLARLEAVKNIPTLVTALHLVNSVHGYTNWVLNIYGSGSMSKEIFELVCSYGLETQICLKGVTNDSIQVLSESDFYLQSSFYEGFGISMIEAMENGVPPITTAVGVAKEIVIDNKNGFLIETMNSEDMAKSIFQACLSTPQEYMRMSQSAIDSVMNRFSSSQYLNQLTLLENRDEYD